MERGWVENQPQRAQKVLKAPEIQCVLRRVEDDTAAPRIFKTGA
jgi:hypothetical protein